MSTTKIGVIGGSGIYDIDGLQNPKWQQVESPWGVPSDELLTGQLAGVEMDSWPVSKWSSCPVTGAVMSMPPAMCPIAPISTL